MTLPEPAAVARSVLCFLAVLAAWSLQAADLATQDGFSFVVFGDNQFATDSRTSGVPERMALPRVVLDLKPNFLLHTGDLMDHGYDQDAYKRFVEYYHHMLNTIPFFPTMGNHDAARGGILRYKSYLDEQLKTRNPAVGGASFSRNSELWLDDDPTPYAQSFKDSSRSRSQPDLPTGVSFKTFYAFRFWNALFISLEQGTRWWANTPRSWLERHLKSARLNPAIKHIIVFMHHPMYSTTMREGPPDPQAPSSGECIQPVRALYEPLFRTYDVSMVFSGHAHLYDRFYVPDDGHPTRSAPAPASYAHNGTGIHYIVTGGGGGPLNRGSWREELSHGFLQRRLCAYHVIQVQVTGAGIRVNVHRVGGNAEAPTHELFDTFELVLRSG